MTERVVFLGDIHGNLEAFQAVLDDLEPREPEHVYCLGDVVGYGPNPIECTDLVREKEYPTLQGNHDEAIALGSDESKVFKHFNRFAQMAAAWTREQLGLESFLGDQKDLDEENVGFLKSLHPVDPWEDIPGVEDCVGSHADPVDAEKFNYIEKLNPHTHAFDKKMSEGNAVNVVEYIRENFPKKRTLITGHSHIASFFWEAPDGIRRQIVPPDVRDNVELSFRLDEDGQLTVTTCGDGPGNGVYPHFHLDASDYDGFLIINPGAIGQPRDRIPDASYMIYEPAKRGGTWYRVPYDVETTVDKIVSTIELPNNLAERLKVGR